jgi:hypothetical protein
MKRTTMADINAALSWYVKAAELLDIQPPYGHRIEYREGSKRNGVPFTLVWVNESTGEYRGVPGTDFNGVLGTTRREAYIALQRIARAFQDAVYYLSQ